MDGRENQKLFNSVFFMVELLLLQLLYYGYLGYIHIGILVL
jgi:hypothetical protein